MSPMLHCVNIKIEINVKEKTSRIKVQQNEHFNNVAPKICLIKNKLRRKKKTFIHNEIKSRKPNECYQLAQSHITVDTNIRAG